MRIQSTRLHNRGRIGQGVERIRASPAAEAEGRCVDDRIRFRAEQDDHHVTARRNDQIALIRHRISKLEGAGRGQDDVAERRHVEACADLRRQLKRAIAADAALECGHCHDPAGPDHDVAVAVHIALDRAQHCAGFGTAQDGVGQQDVTVDKQVEKRGIAGQAAKPDAPVDHSNMGGAAVGRDRQVAGCKRDRSISTGDLVTDQRDQTIGGAQGRAGPCGHRVADDPDRRRASFRARNDITKCSLALCVDQHGARISADHAVFALADIAIARG